MQSPWPWSTTDAAQIATQIIPAVEKQLATQLAESQKTAIIQVKS